MASGTKKKTTMAKLMREQRLRERRQEKAQKKDQRKREAAMPPVVEVEDEVPAEESLA